MSGGGPRPTRSVANEASVVCLERTGDYVFATWRNLVIAYWIGPTRSTGVVRLNAALERLARQFKDGVGLVQIIHEKAPAPDSTSRSALQAMLRSRGDIIACSSVVSPGTGFRAASVRAVITALVMLARPNFPHVVHVSIRETATWHAEHLPAAPDPAEAEQVYRAITSIAVLESAAMSGLRAAAHREP